jgi:hypothetical protein
MPVKGLTQAEIDEATRAQVASGAKSTDRVNRLPGETGTEANARITAAYKEMTAKPIVSQEAKDAGVQVKFVRTGDGGVGEYQVVKPIGYTGPDVSKTTEFTSGVIPSNVTKTTGTSVGFNPDDYKTDEDRQRIAAKLASGKPLTVDEQAFINKGITPAVTSSTSTTKIVDPLAGKTPDQIAAYNSAKELAQSFVDTYGGQLSDYFDVTTGKVTRPTDAVISKKFENTGKTEVSRVDNGDGTFTVTYSDKTTAIIGTKNTSGDYKTTDGILNFKGKPFTGTYNGKVYENGIVKTASTTDTASVIDTGPTLAADVFKQTLAVFFGAAEMAKPWANELYKVVSKFYKTGASAEESFNMALLESRNNPAMTDFTKRFKGIYALQDMKQQGKAVTVPTIAEYFATESKMGDMLKASNLGDLANEDFLGDVLSKGVSATEFGNRITQIFDRIDNAPKAIKTTLDRFFPYLDRTSLARALALGDKGASTLQQEIAGYEVLAAGEFQGLGLSAALPSGITNAQAQDIAKAGGTFASTLPQFGQIARARETEQKLAEISGKKSLGVTGLTSAVISKSAAELKALEDLTTQEEARFMGKAGTSGSRALASQARANRLI